MLGPAGKTGTIDLRTRAWFNENLESRNFFVPGVLVVVVTLATLLLTSMAVVREKEIGTMEQIMVTPITPAEFILGKTIPFAIIGFVDVILVVLIGVFWFEVPIRGNPAAAVAGHRAVPDDDARRRPADLDRQRNAAAGDDDDVLLLLSGHAALGLRLSDRQHAAGRAVDDAGESDALLSGDRPRHLPEGRGDGHSLAADAAAAGDGHGHALAGRAAIPQDAVTGHATEIESSSFQRAARGVW